MDVSVLGMANLVLTSSKAPAASESYFIPRIFLQRLRRVEIINNQMAPSVSHIPRNPTNELRDGKALASI